MQDHAVARIGCRERAGKAGEPGADDMNGHGVEQPWKNEVGLYIKSASMT
jgi:hypothetical protein